MGRRGVAVAGNMILDKIKIIDCYPKSGNLAHVNSISNDLGGCVNNVALGLAKLDSTLPVYPMGMVGEDADGDYIMSIMQTYDNIDVSYVIRRGMTSFTDVFVDQCSLQRTFFAYSGIDTSFRFDDVTFEQLPVSILHVGYILLLQELDALDAMYGTALARKLHDAQAAGIKTSIDVVSEEGDRFKRLVPPSLKYTDYCIINEIEASLTTGVPLRDGDLLIEKNMEETLYALKGMGVSTWAVIHCPEGGFGLDEENIYTTVPSCKLPKGYIKDTVGAGDAFCAGVLYEAQQQRSLREAIELGIASATCSLSENGSTKGMRSAEEARKLYIELNGHDETRYQP